MLAVLCGGLLVSRLSAEVGQARWRALVEEEQARLRSVDHWLAGLGQPGTAAGGLWEGLGGIAKQLEPAGKSGVSGKKWVRPESVDTTQVEPSPTPEPSPEPTISEGED